MELENRILGFQNHGAIVKNRLDNSVLAFVNILQRPNVDGLMIIMCQECFFDAMHFFISDDDDVERVSVKTNEESPLDEGKNEKESHENTTTCRRVIHSNRTERYVSCHNHRNDPEDHPEKRYDEPDPVLAEVKLQLLVHILALEGSFSLWNWNVHHMKSVQIKKVAMRNTA